MKYTVGEDGNTLSGSWFDPNLNTTVPTTYIRIGLPSTISITVETDKQSYQQNDTITITGQIEGVSNIEGDEVLVEVYAPDNTQYTSAFLPVVDQGSYSYPLRIINPTNGTYRALSTFEGASDQATFSFDKQIEQLPILVTSVTATAVAAAVGGTYIVKKGYIKKHLINHKQVDTTDSLTIIDIRFECGIMNYKVNNESKTSLIGDITEIEDNLLGR